MNLNNVNRRNTREWAFFNGNSRGEQHRNKLIEKHGGYWEKKGREWYWHNNTVKAVNFPNTTKPRATFLFAHKDGTNYITDNFTGFCREHSINASAMHEVLQGKRKQFKGFVVTRFGPQDNPKNC